MLTNDTIIKNNCDNFATNTTMNSIPINISYKNSNSCCNTILTILAVDASKVSSDKDQQNNETKCQKQLKMQKSESFPCDTSSMMSCCREEESGAENEANMENRFANEGDEESREEEIFYDSTNENEDLDGKGQADFGLSKLCLNDIEIDRKEEEQTVSDLVKAVEKDKIIHAEHNKNMRLAFGVLLRLILPLANGVVQGIKGMRDVRFLNILRGIVSSRQALINLFAFAANTISMNLSSVQVSHRIEPILKLFKICKSRDGIESLPDSPTLPNGPEALMSPTNIKLSQPIFSPFARELRYSLPNFQTSNKAISVVEYVATKCCTLNILAEPPPGEPIRADIVFIHGLHGSLVNTWKQGLWENERRPVKFQRPPKPPIRPPKRPRHSRTSAVHPLHHKKRARFAHTDVYQRYSHERESIEEIDENSYYFICGEPKDLQICDGIEYSFPTFRLRLNDNGRLLQAETNDKEVDDDDSSEHSENSSINYKEQNKKNKSTKPSANDPNYSKCWPEDWLPLDCPGVRVIALNYTTDQHLWRPLWKRKEPRSNLIQRSREMTELLIKHRVGYGHPIVWVGHSKGGLFIKQIIVDAWESGRPAAAPFWRSARGVFFYSVPHRGSHLASIKAPLLLRSVELIDIEKNNKYLLDLHRRFAGLYHMGHLKIEVFSFVETALTLMSVLYMRIVGADSADPGIGDVCGIRLDHREICKPRSRDCILYKQLVNMINKVC